MKRRQLLLIPLLIIGMGTYILSIYATKGNFLKRKKAENITFLSGGLTEPERKNLEEMGKKYSLKVIFSNARGEYLSDVTMTILDQTNEPILTTISGPWFFINLPSGTYSLEASFQKNRKRISQLKIDGNSQTVIRVQW